MTEPRPCPGRRSRSRPRRWPGVRVPAAAAAVLALVAACGSASGSPSAAPAAAGSSAAGSASDGSASGAAGSGAAVSGSITVLAAASLTGSFTELGRRFEAAHPGTTVRFSFGASSTLAQQVIAGAPADVFASASTRNMTQVTDAGDASDPRVFAANEAEIAVAPGSASKVRSLSDLGAAGVTVALCQPQVPCGALAQQVLAKAGVAVHPVTQGLDVKSTLQYVASGEVDAAVVYVTDVRAAGSKVTGVAIPADRNASTDYPIATVAGSGNPALAEAFESWVLSADGRAVLSRAGFATP